MIIGDRTVFAIESDITQAFEGTNFQALGYFVIHVAGIFYGVNSPEAALLGWAYGEVKERIAKSGMHDAPFATEPDAGKIADAFRDAIYAPDQEGRCFFGLSEREFCKLFYANELMWNPGDETFDDGSYVLHFDVGNRVRLIAFKSSKCKGDYHHDPKTLTDIWLNAETFYAILKNWHRAFEAEWVTAPKISRLDYGTKR